MLFHCLDTQIPARELKPFPKQGQGRCPLDFSRVAIRCPCSPCSDVVMGKNRQLSRCCTTSCLWHSQGKHKHWCSFSTVYLLVYSAGFQRGVRGPVLAAAFATGRTYVLAFSTGLRKLLLMAGDTVEVIALGEEAPRSNHFLALAASETVLMPDHLLVLNILVSCTDRNELLRGISGSWQTPHPVQCP